MYEGDVSDDSITFISSDKPEFVMQYMKGIADERGDGAMVIVPPTEMFARGITFPVYNSLIGSGWKYYINIKPDKAWLTTIPY